MCRNQRSINNGWASVSRLLSSVKLTKTEFLTASLYYSPNPDHQEILATIQNAFNGETRPTAFPKELLDIGIRSALALGDTASAAKLARSGSSSVSPTFYIFCRDIG